jgi:hypothetical protein
MSTPSGDKTGFNKVRIAETLEVDGTATFETGVTFQTTATGRFIGTAVTQTGAGALSLLFSIVRIVSTGANALTLANGTAGQEITLVMITDGGDATLTPANKVGFSTITFNDIGDTATLVFTNSNWYIKSVNGATVA